MGDQPPRPRIRGRRIVERPRLTALLDRSRAPVRTLVAGPGYGKTILLEQWAPRDGRTVGWYRARRSAVDVAVVARELVSAVAPIVPGAGRRMLERLSVTEDPEREAVLLGEMLAEDLAEWPADAWIVIDDYHHLAQAEGSERFVEVLATRSPAQLLIASRERPLWVHGKALLYGDVFELTQPMLAMTLDEAEQVLEGGRLDLSSGLLTLAEGWPAVIGLAGMAPDVTEIDADMPDTLYAFFAEEVYRGLGPTLAEALTLLAALPTVDRELAEIVLGPAEAAEVCAEALALGILDARDDRLEFHPLAAAFLHARRRSDHVHPSRDVDERVLQRLVVREDWDAALQMLQSTRLGRGLPGVVVSAVETLSDVGRVREAEAWLAFARDVGIDAPEVALAEAEACLRSGRHLTALTVSRGVLARGIDLDPALRYRALVAGARGAHIGSLEAEALRLYGQALECAPNQPLMREAQWGQLMCMAAMEMPEAHVLLAELEASARTADPHDLVRTVDKQFSVGFRFGRVHDVDDGRRVAELADQLGDPIARCSFRSMFSWALVLSAYFGDARQQADALVAEATEYRLDPVLPYGYSTLAASLAGCGDYSRALDCIDQSARLAARIHDENGIQNAYSIKTRILLEAGEAADACATEPPSLVRALPSMQGEVIGSRALALASIGRLQEALHLAELARSVTSGVEAHRLADAAELVVALKARSDGLVGKCSATLNAAFMTGAVALLVTAYRANRELLPVLFASPDTREQAVFLVRRAGDEQLSEATVGRTAAILDPIDTLSKREKEIHDLACEGLTNREIGQLLFLAEGTVKSHLHRVYEKLDVHSRAALILNAGRRSGRSDPGGNEGRTNRP